MSPNPIDEYQTDHDLLVTLNERVKNLIGHVEAMVNSNAVLSDDHEKRIRILEETSSAQESSSRTWRYGLTLAISLIGMGLTIIAIVVSTHS